MQTCPAQLPRDCEFCSQEFVPMCNKYRKKLPSGDASGDAKNCVIYPGRRRTDAHTNPWHLEKEVCVLSGRMVVSWTMFKHFDELSPHSNVFHLSSQGNLHILGL